jgi:hypothetical protein
MKTLFENYELFIQEHANDISNPAGALKMLTDNGMYRAYIDSLTEGLEPGRRAVVAAIADRQRNYILTEGANVPASSFGFGWTVLSFPILVDIYAEPIISELCNVYPTDSPVVSIPRVRIKSKIVNFDGSVVEKIIPTARELIRADFFEHNIAPGAPEALLTAGLGADAAKFKMNRRYFSIVKANLTENGNAKTVSVSFRPDNRAGIKGTFTYQAADSGVCIFSIHGNVNWDTGEVIYSVVSDTSATASTVVLQTMTFQCRFTPVESMKGRTQVGITTEMMDVTIDPNEDFMIKLPQEDIQDYKAIFKIDLVRTLSEAIKRQILLNKDFDLKYFLEASEGDMAANGAVANVDLRNYNRGGGTGDFAPANVLDILRTIVPRIATLNGIIYRNFRMYPQYIVTGLRTAALLKSLQDMMVNMPDNKGSLGWNGSSAQFANMKILECPAVDDSKMYLSTKAPQNALEKATIIDLIHQPLYIVQEITDGNLRHFVRSRTIRFN